MYEDAFGKVYCTPFAEAYLNAQTWSNLGEFVQGKSVSDFVRLELHKSCTKRVRDRSGLARNA
jgi:hypothetical protein